MKKLKDLIYDYNDIFLAIIIIIVAGAVIFWKVSDIMAYPSFAKQQQEQQQSQDVNVEDIDLTPSDVTPNLNPGTDVIGEDDPEGGNPVAEDPTPQKPTGDVKFEIKEKEYLSTVASNLKAAGLISDDKAFIKTVEDLKLDSKIQIGEFTIPAGSTAEQIARIITKTN